MNAPTQMFPPGGTLEEALASLQQVMEEAPAATEATAIDAVRTEFRKRQRTMLLIIAVMMLLIVVGGTFVNVLLFQQVAAQSASNADQDLALKRSQATLDAFQGQLDKANASLIAQGLPPVSGPINPVPGSPEQAQLITAAGTATTLANLPREVMVAPSPQALAAAVASYVQANRGQFAPDPNAVIDGVAAYFAQNPVPAGLEGAEGKQGDPGIQGEPGRAPTAEEIRQAFRDEVAANPQLLCPQGGTYRSAQVVTQDDQGALRATPQFGCFGEAGGVVTAPDPTPVDPGGGGNTGGGDAATSPPDTSGGTTPESQAPQDAPSAPASPEPSAPSPTPTEPPVDDLPGLLGSL